MSEHASSHDGHSHPATVADERRRGGLVSGHASSPVSTAPPVAGEPTVSGVRP